MYVSGEVTSDSGSSRSARRGRFLLDTMNDAVVLAQVVCT